MASAYGERKGASAWRLAAAGSGSNRLMKMVSVAVEKRRSDKRQLKTRKMAAKDINQL
jgi:hypothetical protein